MPLTGNHSFAPGPPESPDPAWAGRALEKFAESVQSNAVLSRLLHRRPAPGLSLLLRRHIIIPHDRPRAISTSSQQDSAKKLMYASSSASPKPSEASEACHVRYLHQELIPECISLRAAQVNIFGTINVKCKKI